MATTTLDYLITDLRLHLGDIAPTAYRYTDEWLLISLQMSVKALGRWWNFKYLMNTSNEAYRNPNHTYLFAEPPVIENQDERPIILMSSIIIKEGSLENNSWNTSRWRDAEISFSNLEGSRTKQMSLKTDWEELNMLMSPPTKRLSQAKKHSLPGYKGNIYERAGDV